MTAAAAFRDEVLDLHRFLDDWLRGASPAGDGTARRLAAALADDFAIIHPDGSRGDRATSLRSFAAAHGCKPAGYALEVADVETRMLGPGLCLATYVERHRGEPGRARLSTAVLRRRPGGDGSDGGIEWLFLQETLAPQLEAAADDTADG